MGAAVHRLEVPRSVFTDEERAAINREARANVSSKPTVNETIAPHRMEDPLTAWKKERNAEIAERERAAERERRTEQREQRQTQQLSDEWVTFIRSEIRSAVEANNEFWHEVMGEVVATVQRQCADELRQEVKKVKADNAALRAELNTGLAKAREDVARLTMESARELTKIGGDAAKALLRASHETAAANVRMNKIEAEFTKFWRGT